jgi:hypothetical protein
MSLRFWGTLFGHKVVGNIKQLDESFQWFEKRVLNHVSLRWFHSVKMSFIVRVRSPEGMVRVDLTELGPETLTIGELLGLMASQNLIDSYVLEQGYLVKDRQEDTVLDNAMMLSELGIQHGDILVLKSRETSKRRSSDLERRSPKKSKQEESSEFPMIPLVPKELARQLVEDEQRSEALMGFRAFIEQMSSRRMEAVEKQRVEMNLVNNGKQISVRFKAGRKEYTEIVQFFEVSLIESAFRHIISIQSTKSRGMHAVRKSLFDPLGIARRSPGVFWSLYWHKDKKQSLGDFVAEICRDFSN